MFISRILLFLFVCIFAACGSSVSQTENVSQAQPKEKTELSLRMERSHCFGTCPVYELNVQPDGKVLFNGIDFTEIKGEVENNLNKEKIEQLVDEIERANFFSLQDLYTGDSTNCPLEVTDSASVKLQIKLNGNEKTINHYLGCWVSDRPKESSLGSKDNWHPKVFPQELYNLENKIDEIVGTKRWIGEGK